MTTLTPGNDKGPPPFETVSQMFEYARAHPYTLRSHWYRYYLTTDIGRIFRYVEEQTLINEEDDALIFFSQIKEKCYKPIPCPHLLSVSFLSFSSIALDLFTNKPEIKESVALTTKHRQIFCLENAYKLTEDEVYQSIANYVGRDISHTLLKT